MARLADYFLIVGYNHEKDKQGISLGKIVQRFPTTDWEDTPFIDGIELFCQPQGWALSTEQMEPRFFVSVLTDMDANRHYCACLTFNETVTIQPTRPVDEEEETFGAYRNEVQPRSTAVTHHSVMYAPKALVLVSRLDCFNTFRNCLGVLYAVYSDNLPVQLEGLVGNILGCVQVPPPGGPQIRFSIGAGDRQAYQPPLTATIPTTGTCVAQLFRQLGIKPAMTLFSAAMTELKILMHSCSYWRLTEACRALSALMYPFKYSYVYIPVLPTSLSEVVTTPTPFIMGVHSNALDNMPELLDVIIVNLDGGCVTVPESIVIAPLPESVRKSTLLQLSKLLHPDLHTADHAFAAPLSPSTEQMLDKEIRAVFLRLFAQLLQGYRNCLTLIRIHPTPVIAFHKASFLGQRGLVDCSFSSRLLDCMFFSTFVSERGLPWRPCDVFDEVYCGIGELLKMEAGDAKLVQAHVRELAQHLLLNERPNQQPFEERFPQPTEGAFRRIHQPVFPELDEQLVAQVIQEGLNNGKLKQRLASIKPPSCRIVPMGPHINTLQRDSRQVVNNSARRLEVLRNCVSCIFESRISDARKSFPAVLRALKNRSARLVLCHELSQHVLGNKAILDNEQFDLVIRLMNCALQDDSSLDEYGVAAAILPLATAFCRKLCTGIIQFAYTCIQEHMVWQNQQFWEAAYYQDVQADIQRLYAPQHESRYGVIDASGSQFGVMDGRDEHHRRTPSSSNSVSSATSSCSTAASSALRDQHRSSAELTALELAADQLRMRTQIENGKLQELIMAEESTVFSQAIHFANRIVFMRVPLDVASHRQRLHNFNERESNSNSLTTSVAETDSMTVESGFEDQEVSSAGQDVIKFVSRFVDQVCTESNVSSQHVRQLHQMVPGVVAMHIETMDAVSRESKRLPSTKKPKILLPSLLPGEEMVTDAVRVYLLPDGREEMTGQLGGPALLPAEGAFFITNYRLIFKGTPCDAYASEMTVVRCFPLSTLTKEKRMNVHYLVHLDQWLQEGLQLRSNTFQLLKLAFDEEVNGENIERLRKLIQRLRTPPSIVHLFAFRGQQFIAVNSAAKDKQKNATLRGFAKKTLLRTARKAGIKTKSSKQQKYMLSMSDGRSMTSPGRMSLSLSTADSAECLPQLLDDELSVVDEADRSSQGSSHQIHMAPMAAVEAVSTERLASRSYYRDWQRLGLGQMTGGRSATLKRMEPFRVSTFNASYTVCRSYPALLPLPCHVGDASAAKVARCHRHGRLPVTTWKHPRTRALLLRGSSFCGKGVRGIIMAHQTTGSSNDSTTVGLEQEKYMSAVVAATPRSVLRKGSAWGATSDSSLSIDSLILQAASAHPDMSSATGYPTLTPESGRRGAASHNPFSKAMSTLRMSGGTGPGNKGSLRRGISPGAALRSPSATTLGGAMFSIYKPSVSPRSVAAESDSCSSTVAGGAGGSSSADLTDAAAAGGVHTFQKASLYVFGDRSHMKSDAFPKTDFIPVDFAEVKQVKVSFKKLMRACVPSSAAADRDQTFLKAVEGSEWLPQIQRIMQVSGAVVDLVDVQGSSVMLCLEDGWDFTAQVSSVAQLCLDPYYRTLEGFRVLVEKEWLAFGHRFSHRSNLTQSSQASGFAPIFLQFLDVVHQIHSQFPLSFEFNQYYLKLLAYHAVSVRFRTFLLDSELERVETGLMAEEDRQHLLLHSSVSSAASSSHCTAPSSAASHPPAAQWFDHNLEEDDDDLPGEPAATRHFSSSLPHSQSVFDYLERHAARTPLLYNFYYVPDPCDQPVLRPHGALSSLRVWSYYCAETLAGGPSYDLEVVALDGRRIEEAEAAEGRPQTSVRRTVTAGYHSRHQLQDSCSYLLEEARRLEAELGQLSQKWRSVWDQLEVPNTDSLARRASPSTQLVRHHGRYVHKRATIKLIMGGKMAISAAAASGGLVAGNGGGPVPPDHPIQAFSTPHRFEKHNYTTPTYCDHCSHVLWGLVKTGMRCTDCGYNAHEKCISSVPKSCNKYKAMLSQSATSGGAAASGGAGYSAGGAAGSAAGDKFDRVSVTSGVTSHHGQSASSSHHQQQQRLYDQFSVRTAEHRTLEGYLYKRGVLLKSWKQRWFVLDSIKHELRYYDGMEDQNCKGVIDLAEVISVNPTAPTPGAPKRVDDKAFFELRTVRRAYSFCANDAQAAQEWVEKMQSCLQ